MLVFSIHSKFLPALCFAYKRLFVYFQNYIIRELYVFFSCVSYISDVAADDITSVYEQNLPDESGLFRLSRPKLDETDDTWLFDEQRDQSMTISVGDEMEKGKKEKSNINYLKLSELFYCPINHERLILNSRETITMLLLVP